MMINEKIKIYESKTTYMKIRKKDLLLVNNLFKNKVLKIL